MTMKKTIIICDDDKSILEVIQIILGEDYNIVTCNSEQDLFKAVEVISPDLILLDVWMGESDGRKIIKSIKQVDTLKHIPVVLISALHNLEKISDESDADSYLKKPFEMDELIELVKRMID